MHTVDHALTEASPTLVTGADALLSTLVEQGVEAVYINPGTDTAPFQHAIEVAEAAGRSIPRLVLCPHETIALAAAHAHFAVTGRVQAVFVHVDVGTQNLGSMIHNAARAEAGVIVFAGLTPYDETGAVPGGRNRTVHWMQDVPDQHGIVRDYVKGTLNPPRASLVAQAVRRAAAVAGAAPSGPVYVTLGREVLMEPAPAAAASRPTLYQVAGPTPDAVHASLVEFRASTRPVFVTTRLGRDPEAVPAFVRLAELLGARVIDQRERMNFPADHPLAVSDAEAASVWREADLVVALDSPIPWVIGSDGPGPQARVLTVEHDPLQTTIPNWAFPADLRVSSSPRAWIDAVLHELEAVRAPSPSYGPRRPRPVAPAAGEQLTADDVLAALGIRLTEDDRVIDEASTAASAVARWLPRTRPGTLFRSGGSGLGWALGALLGAQVADPERASVVVVGDGGFMFGAPIAGLTAMRRAGVGGLVVVMQNGGYAASSRPVHQLFPDPHRGQPPATSFDAEFDAAAIAAACGAIGVSVTSHADLEAGIERSVAAWRRGELVVLGAHVASPWIKSDRD